MKNVLITGGTRGIGASCAELFSKNGYRVFVIYHSDKEKAQKLCERINCISYRADICSYEQIEKTVKDITEKYGSIEVLINNAGIAQQKLFIDTDSADWGKMIDTNLTGTYNVTNVVIKSMIKNHSGSIVNVSSIWGVCGASCEVHYSAAKSGIIGFTKALAKEVGLSGIRVNCVAPGIIDTEMNNHLSRDDIKEICEEIPMGRVGKPDECAELIYFLASEKASYITGQTVEINGGWNV
ncbi:MAG: 3-oxoacyl-ACP reductase FabG [Clostridia bacterium]|nr:3-oxoacyl-ACP reductase FabG [Clostridia bacterium]